ncbi:hypothetical protein J2T15_003779 [Paenibacillus harenae]|uniref:Uncharacterized protein n=1 Tax=Paenibacillus harenae TaxID=306543 RepID=A0ABT9U7X9_PAEHA|nr:hypothetical protein [Paenibacillus harenae]
MRVGEVLIKDTCDADSRTIAEAILKNAGFKFQIDELTLEWAQQTYNCSIWEPRPWPGQTNLKRR